MTRPNVYCTKPTVVAADAGPMGIECWGGSVERWAGCAQTSRTAGVERGIVVGEARLCTVDESGVGGEQIYCARRHRRAVGAETPETFVMLIVLSCASRDRKRWRAELDFGGSESFDDHHGASTSRTAPKIFRSIGG